MTQRYVHQTPTMTPLEYITTIKARSRRKNLHSLRFATLLTGLHTNVYGWQTMKGNYADSSNNRKFLSFKEATTFSMLGVNSDCSASLTCSLEMCANTV